MKTRRLSPTLGVEISGVDLSKDLDAATFDAIREAWLAHKVAVFPGQTLTEKDLMRFGRRFAVVQRDRLPRDQRECAHADDGASR